MGFCSSPPSSSTFRGCCVGWGCRSGSNDGTWYGRLAPQPHAEPRDKPEAHQGQRAERHTHPYDDRIVGDRRVVGTAKACFGSMGMRIDHVGQGLLWASAHQRGGGLSYRTITLVWARQG